MVMLIIIALALNIQVSVGEYLLYTLDIKLVYDVMIDQNPSNLSTIIPAILVPLLVVIIALAALMVGLFYFNVIRTKRKFEMTDEGGERYKSYILTINITPVIIPFYFFAAKPMLLQCRHSCSHQTCKSSKSCVSTFVGLLISELFRLTLLPGIVVNLSALYYPARMRKG